MISTRLSARALEWLGHDQTTVAQLPAIRQLVLQELEANSFQSLELREGAEERLEQAVRQAPGAAAEELEQIARQLEAKAPFVALRLRQIADPDRIKPIVVEGFERSSKTVELPA